MRETKKEKCVVALGFFDCVHLGHKELLREARELANELKVDEVAMMTFSGNPYAFFGSDRKLILSGAERNEVCTGSSVNVVLNFKADEKTFSLSPDEFLKKINQVVKVVGFVSGKDFTYGKDKQGNVETLRKYCEENGIALKVVDTVLGNGEKISSKDIYAYLVSGEVEKANALLGYDYFVSGEVVSGRGDGRKNGVPTLNLLQSEDKVKLPQGVYATETEIEGKVYPSLTNVGEHPTYGDFSFNLETYVLDFSGEVKGNIKVSFKKFIREIKTFSTPLELKAQIEKDVKTRREIK